jgi:hypothetical protein
LTVVLDNGGGPGIITGTAAAVIGIAVVAAAVSYEYPAFRSSARCAA